MAFTDIGSMYIKTGSLDFKGKKLAIKIANVKETSLVRQRINWIIYLTMDVFFIIYFAFLAKEFPGVFSFSFLFLFLLIGNAFGLIVGYSTKWVQIRYFDERNKIAQAFFADGSFLGWNGIFGGTEKMYQTLRSLLKEEKRDTPSFDELAEKQGISTHIESLVSLEKQTLNVSFWLKWIGSAILALGVWVGLGILLINILELGINSSTIVGFLGGIAGLIQWVFFHRFSIRWWWILPNVLTGIVIGSLFENSDYATQIWITIIFLANNLSAGAILIYEGR